MLALGFIVSHENCVNSSRHTNWASHVFVVCLCVRQYCWQPSFFFKYSFSLYFSSFVFQPSTHLAPSVYSFSSDQHAVLTGASKRYASTHRVSKRDGHTLDSVLARAARVLQVGAQQGNKSKTLRQIRAEFLCLNEIEFEWLRQFFVQGICAFFFLNLNISSLLWLLLLSPDLIFSS